jgi:hypothetical protein
MYSTYNVTLLGISEKVFPDTTLLKIKYSGGLSVASKDMATLLTLLNVLRLMTEPPNCIKNNSGVYLVSSQP